MPAKKEVRGLKEEKMDGKNLRTSAIIIVIAIAIVIVLVLVFSGKTKQNSLVEKYPFLTGNCEEILEQFLQVRGIDGRKIICTHRYLEDEITGQAVLKDCSCNYIECNYIYNSEEIGGIKECVNKMIEVNKTLINQVIKKNS